MGTADVLFTYHPPNERTAPKYAMVREAEARFRNQLTDAVRLDVHLDNQMRHRLVNDACRAFYEAIEAVAPKSADTTTALRLVRLVRMRINASIVTACGAETSAMIRDARFWACAAIALDDAQSGAEQAPAQTGALHEVAQRWDALDQAHAQLRAADDGLSRAAFAAVAEVVQATKGDALRLLGWEPLTHASPYGFGARWRRVVISCLHRRWYGQIDEFKNGETQFVGPFESPKEALQSLIETFDQDVFEFLAAHPWLDSRTTVDHA